MKLAVTAGTAAALVGAKRQWENLFGTLTNSDTAAAVTGELAGITLEQLGTEKGKLALEAGAKIYAEDSNRIIREDAREFDRSELIVLNHNFRPINEIVSEGLKLYEEGGGKPKLEPIAIPDPKLTLSDIETVVTKTLGREVGDTRKIPPVDELAEAVHKRIFEFNYFTATANNFSWEIYASYSEYVKVYPLGGLLKELIEKNGLPREDWAQFDFRSVVGNAAFAEAPEYFRLVRQNVRERCFQPSSPVSASRILAYFLELNDGRMGDSLWDTAILLKMFCRNIENTGNYIGKSPEEVQHQLVGDVSTKILDEYSLAGNYHLLEKLSGNGLIKPEDDNLELSPLNRVGALYHGWNIAALLTIFPAEYVIAGIVRQQLGTFSRQGYAKVAADLAVASRLKRVEEILEQYRKP